MTESRTSLLKSAWPWLLMFTLWTAAFSVLCSLPQEAWGHAGSEATVADRLLGSTRVLLADKLYERGDDYFHRGVPHQKAKAFTDFFQTWTEQIHPVGHVHATGKSVHEVMPWLDFTIRMNPHHIEAYLVASFWLAGDGERPDLAMEVLAGGLRSNPRDYQLYGERGRLYLLQGNDDLAEKSLRASIRLWPSGRNPNDEEVRYDLARNFSYLSVLRQAKGGLEEALDCARIAAQLMPENASLLKRLKALENGSASAEEAREIMNSIFPLRGSNEHVCSRTEEHDHEHEH
ncbi:MAG: tetratricopeptide repeat protein [Kiritimatiellia bacterium]